MAVVGFGAARWLLDQAPQPLGAIPRIGAGSRMSAALFPGSYRAMDACGFAANTIQNSVRELELMENILAGRQPEVHGPFVPELPLLLDRLLPRLPRQVERVALLGVLEVTARLPQAHGARRATASAFVGVPVSVSS